MEYFPFDSEVTYDTSGNPVYDRSANSSDLSMIFSAFYSNGLVPEITDNFKVSISSGMTVSVSAGAGFIEGKICKETSATSITIDTAGTTYARIDTVVLRLNTNREYRNIDLSLLKGTASASPVATALTRTGGIYELALAEITVGANVSQITASMINDTRLDTTKCGYITPIAGAVDTDDFTSQIQSIITTLQNEINSIEQGSAVMLKATYDTNDSGRVDNADYDNTSSGLTATDTKSAIDEVNAKAVATNAELSSLETVVTGNATAIPSASGATNSLVLKKFGKLVVFSFLIWSNSITGNGWTSLAKIPSKFLPTSYSTVEGTAAFANGANGAIFGNGRCELNATTGIVAAKTNSSLSALSGVSGELIWIID